MASVYTNLHMRASSWFYRCKEGMGLDEGKLKLSLCMSSIQGSSCDSRESYNATKVEGPYSIIFFNQASTFE